VQRVQLGALAEAEVGGTLDMELQLGRRAERIVQECDERSVAGR